jgi:hypothetical protein
VESCGNALTGLAWLNWGRADSHQTVAVQALRNTRCSRRLRVDDARAGFLLSRSSIVVSATASARGAVRVHIVSHKNDHGPSYRRYRGLQRSRRLRINSREIFGVVRFSTFCNSIGQKATFRQLSGRSALSRRPDAVCFMSTRTNRPKHLGAGSA